MRHFILNKLRNLGCVTQEIPISEEDLLNADEVFLTNATRGMVWVESYKGSNYAFSKTYKIHADMFAI
jgi:branched-subunit amino acid aminotransferase/4-amino-4-deoxychorismate lyase